MDSKVGPRISTEAGASLLEIWVRTRSRVKGSLRLTRKMSVSSEQRMASGISPTSSVASLKASLGS